jgi:hypothetical protein
MRCTFTPIDVHCTLYAVRGKSSQEGRDVTISSKRPPYQGMREADSWHLIDVFSPLLTKREGMGTDWEDVAITLKKVRYALRIIAWRLADVFVTVSPKGR